MSDLARDSSDQYERLRAWYLASLRSNAIKDLLGVENASMTPAALIHADSRLMQKLVGEDTARPAIAGTIENEQRDVWLVVVAMVVFVAAACALPCIL